MRFTPKLLLIFFVGGLLAVNVQKSAYAQQEVMVPVQALELQEVLRQTYLNNPTLQAARAELYAVHERLPQADAGWKPKASANTSITQTDIDGSNFGAATGSTAKDFQFSVEQPLYRGGRTVSEITAAKDVIAAQTSLLWAQEQDILRLTAERYMDVLRDQDLLLLNRNLRDVIAREYEASQLRFEAGELTKTDVSQAQARLSDIDSQIITAQGNLKTSRAAFTELTGLAAANLVIPEMALPTPVSLEQAHEAAKTSNPLLQAAAFAYKAAEEDVDSIYGELLPEVGLFGRWNKTYDPSPGLIDEQTTTAVGVSASIPLYEGGATRSRVRQAKHTANQRYIEIIETQRGMEQDVVAAWESLTAARAEIQARQAQADAAAVAQEGVRAEQEFGLRTVLDALDADQELRDAQVGLVGARRNAVVSEFNLLSAIGLLTPETLGFAQEKMDYGQNVENVRVRILDMHVDSVQEIQ